MGAIWKACRLEPVAENGNLSGPLFFGRQVGLGDVVVSAFEDSDNGGYPVFVDPLLAEREDDLVAPWYISDALLYLLAQPNPGDDYIAWPSSGTITDLLETLAPPSGSILLDPSQMVTATVHVAPLQMTETIQAQASVVNKGSDVDTTGSPPSVSLTVSGPSPILSQLASANLQVVLDVSGKGAGHYDIAPQVQNLPQGISLDSTATQTVAVDLASTTPSS